MYLPGECIIIETNRGKDGTISHLFIVVIPVENDGDKTILLPLCRIKPNRYYDKTVTLGAGDHDFVKEPTYIDFSLAKIETKASLDEAISIGKARKRTPGFGEDLAQKVFNGIQKSPHTPFIVFSYYEDYLFGKLKT